MKRIHLLCEQGELCCSPLKRPRAPGPQQLITKDPRLVTCEKCQKWGFGDAENYPLKKLPRPPVDVLGYGTNTWALYWGAA